MEIRVRRETSAVWEDIENILPHDQDIAKRILWQPEGVESSLGVWWWWDTFNSDGTKKQVLITEGEHVAVY